MADDDDVPAAAASSALRSAWVEAAPFPPLPSAARNVSTTAEEEVVDAVAAMPAEGLPDGSAPHRAPPLRKAAASELLFMLERYHDEDPPLQLRLDVIRTCIVAAYPDVVANDARYQSAMRWFRSLEVTKRGEESSGGILSDPSQRLAALARLRAEVEVGKKKVADALAKKKAAEERALLAARKLTEAAEKRAAKDALEETRRARARSSHAAAAAAPQEMPRAMGSGGKGIADVDDGEHGREEQPRSAPYRPKPRVKQLPYHVEIMGGPAGRNETEAGDLTSMTRTRKRDLCWRGLRVLQEWAQSIINEWVAGGCDAKAPPQVIAVPFTVHSSQFIVHSSQSVMTVHCVHSSQFTVQSHARTPWSKPP